MIRKLNPKEEMVMNILWKLKRANIQEIIDEMSDHRAHYNTISSITRKMEKEGFIDREMNGRNHIYFPVASKKAYRYALFEHLFSTFFEGDEKMLFNFLFERFDIDKTKLRKLGKSLK